MTQSTHQPAIELSAQDREKCIELADGLLRHRASDEDIAVVEKQLGRYPRGIISIGARCVCGTPLAVITRPLVNGKIPFPTTCYLTSPEAVKAMSHLEAVGRMNDFTEQLGSDEDLHAGYERAHAMYLAFRHRVAETLGDTEEHIEGTTAGGMPVRVKCLHALLAQALVMGPGVNPIADMALSEAHDEFNPTVCRCAIRVERAEKE
jgi:hypothetical protein